jgi:hypothetical protein
MFIPRNNKASIPRNLKTLKHHQNRERDFVNASRVLFRSLLIIKEIVVSSQDLIVYSNLQFITNRGAIICRILKVRAKKNRSNIALLLEFSSNCLLEIHRQRRQQQQQYIFNLQTNFVKPSKQHHHQQHNRYTQQHYSTIHKSSVHFYATFTLIQVTSCSHGKSGQ